jgi:hypothetical protein
LRDRSGPDPLIFFCSIGIGAADFVIGRCVDAARYFSGVLAEHPPAVWINRNRAAALAGRQHG